MIFQIVDNAGNDKYDKNNQAGIHLGILIQKTKESLSEIGRKSEEECQR